MKRVGILGGSYNPPHSGHLHIAEAAQKELGLDEVWLWVSYNIFKDPAVYAPLADRTTMASLLAEDRPWLKAVNIEKDFSDTMTATSLTTLKTLYPDNRFIWIFGDDNFSTFHTWNREKFQVDGEIVPDWKYIMNNFSIAVMQRPGYRESAKNSLAASYGKNLFVPDPKQLGFDNNGWTFVDNPESPESSTAIKENLLTGVKDIPGLPPVIENYIYQYGLFHTSTEFNGVSQSPAPANNKVAFPAFLLLASTANLVKVVAHYNSIFNTDAFLTHADASWDRANQKGDFGKKSEVSGEIADCFISLYWLASKQGIKLEGTGIENQQTVTEWCDLHYPGRNIELRIKDYIEELSELCVSEGLEKHRFINLLRLVFDDPAVDDLSASFNKNYEILQSYAKDSAENLDDLLENKMRRNRTRSPLQSEERLDAKNPITLGEPHHDL